MDIPQPLDDQFDYVFRLAGQVVEETPPLVVRGRVLQVVGTIIRASVPGARIGDLCVLLDDAGQGDAGLVVKWWDLQPAETIPSIARAAADVRAHDAKLAAPERRRSTRAQPQTPSPGA